MQKFLTGKKRLEGFERKQGTKQSELESIPKNWNIFFLKEKTTKIGSGITPRGGEKVYKKEGRPFIRSQNVGWGNFILGDVVFIDEKTHSCFNSTEIRINDVLLNITGASIGRSAVADSRIENGNVNQHVCIIRTKSQQLSSYYLNNFLLSNRGLRQIDMFQAGGNREGLNFGQIGSIQILIPTDIEEQHLIVEILSDMGELIKQVDYLITKKKNIKQGTMQELLTGKKRLKGFDGKWITDVLGKHSNLYVPMRDKPKKFGGNIPWIRIEDLDGKFIFDSQSEQYVTSETVQKMNLVVYPVNTVLCSCSATIGVCVITKRELITNQTFIGIHPNLELNSEFLYYYLQTQTNNLIKIASGSTILYISRESFKEFPIPILKIEEQIAIIKIFSDMDLEIKELETKRDKYIMLKNGMMQKLLTGKIRLT